MDLDDEPLGVASYGDVGMRRLGMAQRVGERLLHDPVGGQTDGRWQVAKVAGHVQGDGQTAAPDALDEGRDVTQAGLRCERLVAVVGAQDAEHAPHLDQCRAPARLDLLQRRGDVTRVCFRSGAGAGGLQHHHAEVVADDVVQLARDPAALVHKQRSSLLLESRCAFRGGRGRQAVVRHETGQPAGEAHHPEQRRRPLLARPSAARVGVLPGEDAVGDEQHREADQRSAAVSVGSDGVRPDEQHRERYPPHGGVPTRQCLYDDAGTAQAPDDQGPAASPQEGRRHQ